MTRREGKLSWKARAEEVSFEVLPKRCNSGTISYMERERVCFHLLFVNFMVFSEGDSSIILRSRV